MLMLVNVLLGWNSDANGKAGTAAARELWTNEHRDIYAEALHADHIEDTQGALNLFVDGIADTHATVVDWASVKRTVKRPYTPAMFADLPDFSFSLANWLDGNESCPLSGWSADACYDANSKISKGSTSWLVAGLNSSHFLPQARAAWSTYHTLALDTAARCKQIDTRFAALAGSDSLRESLVKRCELEALMFEGVAQHYQQDAWSSGHMWQRWGSSNIHDWGEQPIDFARALLVGTMAGLVHGTESLPLCAPSPDVAFRTQSAATPIPGVGDNHLSELLTISPVQAQLFDSCVRGSLDEVVSALPGRLGGVSGGHTHPGDTCFDQRATNGAIRSTMLASHEIISALFLRFVARFKVGWDGVDLSSVTQQERDALVSRAERDMLRWAEVVAVSRYSQANSDTDTNLANGQLIRDDGSTLELTMLDMRPNGVYENRIASLVTYDPSVDAVTGGVEVSGEQATAAKRLRYGLYEAHPDYWCSHDLAGEIQQAADRCRDATLDASARDAHCQVCAGLGAFNRREGYGPIQPGAVSAVCDAFDNVPVKRLYLPPGIAPGAVDSLKQVEAWCRAGCATKLRMVAVNAAGAGVDGEAVLTNYYNILLAKISAWRAMSSYYYSIGQISLGQYYATVASSLEQELIAAATLIGAAHTSENGFGRWNGGYAEDDFTGPLGNFVGVSEHAVSKLPSTLRWDAELAGLPTQSFAFSLVNNNAYPFVFVGSAKVVVDEATGAPVLRLRNVEFLITPYLDSAKLKVSVDGIQLVALDNFTAKADELRIQLTPGVTTRLSFDIEALGRSEDLFNLAYNKPLNFRLLALDLAVDGHADAKTCGLR